MMKISCFDKNICIEGIYDFDNTRKFRKYTDDIIKKYPRLTDSDRRCAGARLRFRTNSSKIRVEINVSNVKVDRGMSFYQANAGYIYVGDYPCSKYAGIISAVDTYESNVISAQIDNSGENDITVFFPRNSYVDDISVFVDDDACIKRPTEHKIKAPFVFYGSSITEQGHTSTPNAYASLLSRFFDADFYNFGASGNAKGEIEIAEYLAKIPKSIFFYDYDHNAPDVSYLAETHEPFFKAFRIIDPVSPVIMTSRPANDTADFLDRTAVVRKTFENAKAAGDKNVYFIEGNCLFGDVDASICTTDRTHPNDLGHYLIAKYLHDFILREHIR